MKTDTPDHRTCPFCGIWMASAKRDQRSVEDDTFECVLCRTVIYIPPDGVSGIRNAAQAMMKVGP